MLHLVDHELFNESFLEDGVNSSKIFHFSHNPIGDTGALGKEYQFLLENNYIWDAKTMTIRPPKLERITKCR